ncbi:CvpA family protein [Flavobacterium sp. UMI-01]|uniref:CvpA family protein n=1 Tax=Flavobacterium sp. UMI-01 TaxID=1441053 RepID=UPI001C7D4EA8|nr:CvpA family protein [Flavobacterium sp. UMI-01]GIZ07807.1 colicin V production protein [Flavobacterium sp. UMI-01]
MGFLDIVLGGLLLYGLFKGIKNGLFVELASFISLLLGIYLAIQFSFIIREILSSVFPWSPKSIEIVAFALTFIGVVIGVHLLAKVFTSLMSFAFLGWVNRLAGGFFSVLKTILILSVAFNLFHKINFNNWLVKQETFDNSTFYNPIQKVSQFVFPKLETWYEGVKAKATHPKPEVPNQE